MDRIVIAVDATVLAIIEGILHLSDDIHPDIHVSGSLLDGLRAAGERIGAKVGIAIREGCLSSGESGKHPLVGVIKFTVVVIELLEVNVGAVFTLVHLGLGISTETGKGTSVLVVLVNVVVVRNRGSESINRKGSIARETWAKRYKGLQMR